MPRPLELESRQLENLGSFDCVVVVTDHSYFDVGEILSKASLIVDTRNLTGAAGSANPRVVKL